MSKTNRAGESHPADSSAKFPSEIASSIALSQSPSQPESAEAGGSPQGISSQPAISSLTPSQSMAPGSGTGFPSPNAPSGVVDYKAWNLLIPVQGVRASQLRDSFNDPRSGGRVHQALDIMSPGGTPVLATADGVVRKLHTSERGGITLYQLDSSGSYIYSYAHLQRYADNVHEGKPVKRGEVIAYVGDTGNAGPGNCHLHFGISTVAAPGKWSGGEPINPYPLLCGR